jgi:hypothetical protein
METTKNVSQESRFPGRDFNPRPPDYEAGVLLTRPRRLIISNFALRISAWKGLENDLICQHERRKLRKFAH